MINRAILRMLLVQALKAGSTLAGRQRIFDALAGNIIQDEKYHHAPIAIVNEGDSTYPALAPFGASAMLEFTIDLAVLYADKKTAQSPDNQKWQLPYSDPGAQSYVARLERGILLALQPTTSRFADLFSRGCNWRDNEVKSLLGGNRSGGVRFAARQLHLTGKTLYEPAPDKPVSGWIKDALDALIEVPETKPEAELLLADLENLSDLGPDYLGLVRLGLDRAEGNILGISGFAPEPSEFVWIKSINGIDPSTKVID
ncbi:MAG: hypothetical protein OIF56_15000 [Cohaesibacter sp.]|nr:hypothetical protein [Cohaesibacter sp.]